MNNFVIHKADTRGRADYGWLQARHTFSFARYYNPHRIHFGTLRVLNNDRVAGGRGFDTHPHDNMEIITIPLSGDLEHKDSMGNSAVIRAGDIQVMSAGTGVQHSEYNKNPDQTLELLQIWVFPNKKNVAPRYDQVTLNPEHRLGKLQQVLSPNPQDEGVWIHQNAWFHLTTLDPTQPQQYALKDPIHNGVYAFVIEGGFTIEGQTLAKRDGMGIWNTAQLAIQATEPASQLLLMEVPMQI
jgi:quercetin 2,3-dioxygenase